MEKSLIKNIKLLKMKSIDRVREIIKYENIPVSTFEKLTGMSNNSIQIALKRGSSLRDETLNDTLNAFQDINPEWLLTGCGEMLKRKTSETFSASKMHDDCKIEMLKERLADKDQIISLFGCTHQRVGKQTKVVFKKLKKALFISKFDFFNKQVALEALTK